MPPKSLGGSLPTEVFISHSSHDTDFVVGLVNVLRSHGIPCWYSATNILGAQQWHDEIGKALNRCDWFILVLSPNSVDSIWVKRELFYALQQNRFENRILPIVFQDCDQSRLSWVLPSLQSIDFEADLALGFKDLLRTWGLGYQPG